MASTALIELPGIGEVVTKRMNQLGLFTTGDLLRSERRRLAEELVGVSVAQIRRWQAISSLGEVTGISLRIAEGIHAGGVETLDEFSSLSLSKLRTLVDSLHSQGIVDAVPADDDLVSWLKDALLLRNTGTLNGTVVGTGKTPLEGVTASCMGQRVISDPRGRFRIRRLPLGRRLLVHLDHPDFTGKTVETASIVSEGVLVGERFRLARKRPGAAPARVLTELEGDKLPSLSGAPIRTLVQNDPPSPHDILRVNELLASEEYKVISRLFDFDGASFIVRSYRMKRSDLPAGLKIGDHLRNSAGKWVVAPTSPAKIDEYRRWIRERRELPEIPPVTKKTEFQSYMKEWFKRHEDGQPRHKH